MLKTKLLLSWAMCLILSAAPFPKSHAAISWVSRGNCGFELPPLPFVPPVGAFLNESITWNQLDGNDYWMQTATVHNLGGYANANGSNWNGMHFEAQPWALGWRSYAGDWHFVGNQFVHGVHYYFDPIFGISYFLGYTFATTCNIYQW